MAAQNDEHYRCQFEYTVEDEGPTGETCGNCGKLDDFWLCEKHWDPEKFDEDIDKWHDAWRCKYVFGPEDQPVKDNKKEVGERCKVRNGIRSRKSGMNDIFWGYCQSHSREGIISTDIDVASKGGRAKAKQRMLKKLPPLNGPKSAQKWVQKTAEWALLGKISQGLADQIRKLAKTALKAHDAATLEDLEALQEDVKELKKENEQLRQHKRPWE